MKQVALSVLFMGVSRTFYELSMHHNSEKKGKGSKRGSKKKKKPWPQGQGSFLIQALAASFLQTATALSFVSKLAMNPPAWQKVTPSGSFSIEAPRHSSGKRR